MKKKTKKRKKRVGRKRAFETEASLQAKVNGYFKHCVDGDNKKKTSEVEVPHIKKPYTMCGLCLYLGICKDTHAEYMNGNHDSKENSFSRILKMSKLKIEADKLEQATLGNYNTTICIFDLKCNHGYIETSRTELTGKDGAAIAPPSFIISGEKQE